MLSSNAIRLRVHDTILQITLARVVPEEVVQVYGICICTLHLPVISVMHDNRSYAFVQQSEG